MSRFHYVILSRAHPGHEEEFESWYRENHLKDVCQVPGVVSGRLLRMDFQKTYELEVPPWQLMTIYELEGEDPAALVEAIRSRSGSAAMPSTDALNKAGMIQAVGHLIAAFP
jgi:hypothetical protein